MKNIFKFLCTIPFLGMTACSSSSLIDTTTVRELDLRRFSGDWYEIARFDHSFERGLTGCKANYTIQENGSIKVTNSGYKRTLDGKYHESVGKARRPDDSIPGKLEVSFFWFFYSDYYVLELADDYRYALIGSSSDDYLWLLSRTPRMEKEDVMYVLQRAEARGYDIANLLWIEQKTE